jgi:transmembrane sensor
MSAKTSIKTERRRNAEAAVWHTRLERGELTPYESAKYKVWSADPINARALSQVRRVWDAMGGRMSSRSPAMSVPASRIRKYWAVSATAAVLACLALSWALTVRDPVPAEQKVVQIHAKQLQDDVLPDNTLVTLQPNAQLEFRMDGAQRSADVPHGEIFFNVASDPQRPFVVRVREGSVTAVGTRFAVRQLDGPPSVVVEEGRVNVKRASGDSSISVTAGQQLTILPSGKLVAKIVDAKSELAWARKVKSFEGKTVAQIAVEFNRRNKIQIVIVDARLGSEIYGFGVFYLDDPENFVDALKSKSKVIVDRPDSTTLRVSREP